MITTLELLLLTAFGSTVILTVLFCVRHYRSAR
jgi:hypothetical protein